MKQVFGHIAVGYAHSSEEMLGPQPNGQSQLCALFDPRKEEAVSFASEHFDLVLDALDHHCVSFGLGPIYFSTSFSIVTP